MEYEFIVSISNWLATIGIFLEIFGTLYAISNKIPFVWNRIKNTCFFTSFQRIDKGLEKLDPENYDIPPTDRTLCQSEKGFKEIFNIINERFGLNDKEFDTMYFEPIAMPGIRPTKETSTYNLLLSKYDEQGNKEYDIRPTTRRDLLLRIDVWKERNLVVTGFIYIFIGLGFQLAGIIINVLFT